MKRIEHDAFYDFIRRYDPDSEYHMVGEVDYHLLCDDRPYDGMSSHREALRTVFDWLAEKDAKDIENVRVMSGDDLADRLRPLIYDIDKAQSSPLDPQKFFYCPNIIRTDYYGNVRYDAGWEPENCGTTVPYWYALMEPVHGRKTNPDDFRKVNEALFPNGTDALDIFEWTTDWSDYFDDGHEWYGACCWSVFDRSTSRYAVLLVSATD